MCLSQWRRDGERTALRATDVSRLVQNVSVDVVTGDHLRRRHHYQQQQQQQQQEGRYYYTSTLTLRSSAAQDSGAYVCSATNNHGFVERRTFLHVIPSGETLLQLLRSRTHIPFADGATAGNISGIETLVVAFNILN